MSSGKKKIKHQPKVFLTLAEKKKIIQQVSADASRKILLLCTAFLMEEYAWTADHVVDFFNKINEWAGAIDEHLITIKKVEEIIENATGAIFRGTWKHAEKVRYEWEPVNPTPKNQKFRCGRCHKIAWHVNPHGDGCKYKFCPNCGADMIVKE